MAVRATDVYIVIPPDDMPVAAAQAGPDSHGNEGGGMRPTSVWKRQKAFLHVALGDRGWRGDLRRRDRGAMAAPMASAAAVSGSRFTGAVRTIEALDLLLVDDPSQADIDALEAAGATVIPNTLLTLVEPSRPAAGAATPADRSWHLGKIKAEAAFGKGLTGRGVTVGVLDTGIDSGHSEFEDIAATFMEFDANGRARAGTPTRDFEKHGTHVCGLLAGKTLGLARGCRLKVAAVLTGRDAGGRPVGTLAQVVRGYGWLLNRQTDETGPMVINASISIGSQGQDLYSQIEKARFGQNVLTIAAIGNNGANGINRHTAPGHYDHVLGVGATDPDDAVAPFSDWGTHRGQAKPDLCAPGDPVLSAIPLNGYEHMRGTSMATPLVSATAALLLEADATLKDNVDRLIARILTLTAPIADKPRGGVGRLDLSRI